MTKTAKAMLITVVLLAVIFLTLMAVASNGYGYVGYYGYHRGPSFFYWGGPSIYHDRNNRGGSAGGPSLRGGGPGSGK